MMIVHWRIKFCYEYHKLYGHFVTRSPYTTHAYTLTRSLLIRIFGAHNAHSHSYTGPTKTNGFSILSENYGVTDDLLSSRRHKKQ